MASLSPVHIPGCARLGVARLKAFRLNVYEVTTPVWINGAPIPSGGGLGLLIEGATITHALNEQVDTAHFTARGWIPQAGQHLAVYSGEVQGNKQLFGGRIVEKSSRYLSKAAPNNIVFDLDCIDPTWLLSRFKVLAVYQQQSATAIILDVMARFTLGFSVAGVQAGLPTIAALTFTNEDVPTCLTQICQMVGAYWYIDYTGTLQVFTTATQTATPMTTAAPGPSGDHALSEDLSQVATRIIGLGGGVGASVDLLPGATELPLDLGLGQTNWYQGEGGIVQTGGQRVTYTKIRGNTGRGAILGTGNAPTVAPILAPAPGTGLTPGTYQWAVTFTTASGETLIGPAATAGTGAPAPTLTPPNVRPGYQQANPAKYTPNANLLWRVSVLYAGSTYSLGAASGPWNVSDRIPEVGVGPLATDPVTGHQYNSWLQSRCPAKIVQTTIYRSGNNGSTVYAWQIWDGPIATPEGWITVGGNPGLYEADLGSQPQYPTGPVATFNAITVTLPKSSSPTVTGRALFRTAVNGSALKRLATIPDNTTPTYLDTNPDSALGAAPPATDTSLLREDGQITAGATSVLVTDPTPFLEDGGAAGGWALVGNLPVRYTGISGSHLVGIPPTGSGSVTATVRYGSQVVVQPRLVGLPASGPGALTVGVRKGDQITLRMEIDDVAARQALADRLGSANPYDGVVEFLVNDSRFGPVELLAHMQATLKERKDPHLTLTYWTRDDTHEVGRLVTVSLDVPLIYGTFRIQKVTLSEISIAGAGTTIRPKRTIQATNKLYTFADLLRQLRGREAGVQ